MKIAPIIHTRTFSCDFNSEFLVRPDRFMDSDIKWARKNVLGATGEIDNLKGFRWVVVDNEKYRLAGVVGFLEAICSELSLSESDKLKSEALFCDNKGRLIYAFIGIVVDKHANNEYGTITLEYLWNIYIDKIYPVWKRSYQEVILERFVEVEAKSYVKTNQRKPYEISSRKFFEANSSMDYELFLYYLCNKYEQGFSFCSNILDFNVVKESDFSIITTSQNIITRISREHITKPNQFQCAQDLSTKLSYSIRTEQRDEDKKKLWILLTSCVVLLIATIVIFLIVKKMNWNEKLFQ